MSKVGKWESGKVGFGEAKVFPWKEKSDIFWRFGRKYTTALGPKGRFACKEPPPLCHEGWSPVPSGLNSEVKLIRY
jgi:hypothetical protein